MYLVIGPGGTRYINVPYLNSKVMRSLVSFVLCEVSVLIRRQQLTPKFSVVSFKGGQVQRKTQRIAATFEGAIKDIIHGEYSNYGHIQIMELVFCENMLSNSV